MDTVGATLAGGVGAAVTVIGIDDELATAPALSVARAVRLWAPTGAIKKITHHDTALKDAEHNWVFPEPSRQVSGQPELFVHLLS